MQLLHGRAGPLDKTIQTFSIPILSRDFPSVNISTMLLSRDIHESWRIQLIHPSILSPTITPSSSSLAISFNILNPFITYLGVYSITWVKLVQIYRRGHHQCKTPNKLESQLLFTHAQISTSILLPQKVYFFSEIFDSIIYLIP